MASSNEKTCYAMRRPMRDFMRTLHELASYLGADYTSIPCPSQSEAYEKSSYTSPAKYIRYDGSKWAIITIERGSEHLEYESKDENKVLFLALRPSITSNALRTSDENHNEHPRRRLYRETSRVVDGLARDFPAVCSRWPSFEDGIQRRGLEVRPYDDRFRERKAIADRHIADGMDGVDAWRIAAQEVPYPDGKWSSLDFGATQYELDI